ncbi:MAG: AAA family ATPase, partial [Dictyoglomus sp.]
MIYLKSLELTNFKSFIGNIKIPFSRNFTVITGPNGSGKSNILDAIRWVLGEQKLKTLRAERNDEVIFGGNKFYSPANYAKVELCIEVFEEEYVISRKIYRDEDSEYCINDKTTRLKDIQLFLSNLGLGRYSFVFLGQGEIEDLLLKEDERIRELIENIAGISGYHEKVKDILLKLEIIESKWNELEERRIEALKTIEVLKNEVNIANKYEELRNKLKDVQDSIRFWAWKKLKNSLEKYLEEKKEVEKRLSLIRSELVPNDNLIAELQVEYERIEGELKDIRRLIEDIDEKIFKLKLDEGILKEKKRILKEKLENLEKEKDILKTRFSQIEVSKKDLLEELKVYYQEDFSEFENGLKIKEKRLQELIIERTKLEDKVKAFEDIFKDFQDLTLLEKRIEKEVNLLKNYRKRLNILQNYREDIESKLIEQSRILRKKEDLYEKNKLEIVRLSNILGELKEGVLESY